MWLWDAVHLIFANYYITTPRWHALVHISCSAEKNRSKWHIDQEINDIPKKEKEFNANKLINTK